MKKLYKSLIIIGAGIVAIGGIYYYVFSPKRIINNNSDINISEIDVIDVLTNGNAHVNIKYKSGEISQDTVMTGKDLANLKAIGLKVVYLPA